MEPTGLTSNVPYTIYYDEDIDLENLWYKDFVKEFRVLPPEEVHPEFKGGVKFKTITVNPVKYLPWLKSELLKEGVLFVRKQVQSIGEAAEIAGPNGIVVNATGLGARSLIGVEDSEVYPIRGQTILVDAPEVKECIGLPLDAGTSSDEVTYMIPRVNQGHVIVGGTYQKNNWDLSVNFETARHIWERAAKFHPALKTEKTRIISHNVGLRPAREGGPRIELEHIKLPLVSDLLHGRKFEVGAEQQFPVIHAYGFGGAGYQGSWGAAEEAVAFLEKI
ncbi:FAD dependent oxidoreductase [Panus rudis PR-1116 ss-1]|nr:FAD dependent oxidoreductase [Panus rudis PR-1116 ss-1]